jgi:2-amino-4-hydroxy-6-hydroxymethyldihydropteridine diphosphokinase
VAEFSTSLGVEALLAELRAIERRCGRGPADPKWAPRAIDLDLLLYDDTVCSTPDYQLPRPDLLRRAYMLGPLAEIAPELAHPTAGARVGQLWRQFAHHEHRLERIALDLNAP